jgi:hypothetical protein
MTAFFSAVANCSRIVNDSHKDTVIHCGAHLAYDSAIANRVGWSTRYAQIRIRIDTVDNIGGAKLREEEEEEDQRKAISIFE